MTNGEKIKEIFPNMRITLCESYVQVMGENYEFNNAYPLKWWNAEYKNDKVDCEHTDCNNCVNHKYCDYEPTTKNNLVVDCVSRQAVIEITAETGALETQARVKALPSVTPIRPKGHWMDRWNKVLLCEDKNCSICGYLAQTKHNYCPHCGADMKEVEK